MRYPDPKVLDIEHAFYSSPDEGTVRGQAILHWNGEVPGELDVIPAESGWTPPSGPVHAPAIRIDHRSEAQYVHLRARGASSALIGARVGPIRPHEAIFLGPPRTTFPVRRVLTVSRWPFKRAEIRPVGEAIYRVSERLVLPGSVMEQTTIDGAPHSKRMSRSGLRVEDGERLLVLWVESGVLHASWQLGPNTGRDGDQESWRWASAIRSTVQLLFGYLPQLAARRVRRGSDIHRREIEEWLVPGEPLDLDLLSPRGRHARDSSPDRILRLTQFFASDGWEAEVAELILDQLADAARQRTGPGRELLVATTMEALLRNLERHPFSEDEESYDWPAALYRFRARHLPGDAWRAPTERAIEAVKFLRHRNAHPDWNLSERLGDPGRDARQAVDHLLLLVWFYGYMILGMAGEEGLQPRFPTPVSEMPPIWTVSYGAPSDKPSDAPEDT